MGEKPIISKKIDDNISYLKELLGIGLTNFDIVFREYKIGRKRAASYSINSMTNDILLTNVFQDILVFDSEEVNINALQKVFYQRVTHSQVTIVPDMTDAVTALLSGMMLFFIDTADEVIVLDARIVPGSDAVESTIEKVTRGSKDSFVETIVFNTALIRRRLRDPNLRFEIIKVGARSKTDVVVCYIKDITNDKLVDTVKERLNGISIDGIPMAEKAIEEYIVGSNTWNPLPRVRYTERPDVATVHLLEGHVCLIVDTSPNILILPVTFWHHLQHVEEFRQNVLVGTFLRLIRMGAVIFSLILPPLWLALVLQHHLLPASLAFLGPKDPGVIPLGFQFLLGEFGVEMVRMATVHVPSDQSTALGFIGAFMLGEFATKVGLFGNEVIFYLAVATIGSFSTPSFELAMAFRLLRVALLLLVILFKFPGFLAGLLGIFLLLAFTKSFGVSYLWPAIPFDYAAMKDLLIRMPLPEKIIRPSALKTKDTTRSNEAENPKDSKK